MTTAIATATATASNLTIVSKVQQAINLLIESERKGLRKRRDLAIALNSHFHCEAKEQVLIGTNLYNKLTAGFAWFDVENGDKSSDGKQVLEYKKSIFDALKEFKHPNPSQAWVKICDYAREELGLPPKTKNRKPASEKLIQALKTALKIAQEHPSPSEAETQVALNIQRDLALLGVDLPA